LPTVFGAASDNITAPHQQEPFTLASHLPPTAPFGAGKLFIFNILQVSTKQALEHVYISGRNGGTVVSCRDRFYAKASSVARTTY